MERDEPLFEISTDKVDTEIPSPAAGTLAEILVEEGKTVGINTVVGRIDDGGDGAAPPLQRCRASRRRRAPAPPAAAAAGTCAAPPHRLRRAGAAPPRRRSAAARTPEQSVEETAGPLSPLVRKMARENNIDLSQVKGTGAGGRITKQDRGSVSRRSSSAAAPAPAGCRSAGAAACAGSAAAAPPASRRPRPLPPAAPSSQAKMRVEPMSTMRQKIAEHMVFSKRTSAHVTTVHKVDMTKVAKMRERHEGRFPGALRLRR